MQALTPPRAPSPCSTFAVAERGEDTVSLPGTEDDSDTTHTAGSEPRTLPFRCNDSQKHRSSTAEIKCHMTASEREADFQNRNDPVEEPKPVWTKSRKRALRYFLLMHFVPVATTLVLFWLYLKDFQWRASDIQLKALLFAAKLPSTAAFNNEADESLIVISLVDILFHRIRYHLLTGRGVSLGLLVSPFRVSNPCSLFQTPFLSSARFTLKSAPELLTISLVVLVSILALLAAPSSGVLMIPRYDWWQVPADEAALNDFKRQDLDDAIYIGASFEDLFPLLIDGRFAPDSARDPRLETPNFSDRFEHILSGLDQILVDGSSGADANVTVVDGATVDSFALAYLEESLDDCELMTCENIARARNTTIDKIREEGIDCLDIFCQSVGAQATAPLAIVSQKLFDRYRTWISASSSLFMITAHPLDSKKPVPTWRQPSVSMQCSTVLHDGHNQSSVFFERWGSFPPFFISPDGPLLKQIEHVEAGGAPSTTYTDVSRLLPPEVTSSTALLMHSSAGLFNHTTYLCLVDARWIESHVWYTAPYATIMRSGVSMNSLRAITGSNTTTTATPLINITAEYANSLDARLNVSSTYNEAPGSASQASPFEFIEQYCRRSVAYRLRPKCSMLAHTLYLTDSLRRAQSFFRYYSALEVQKSESLTLDPESWTKLDYRLYHQVHAYKFEGSIIKLSMSVLLVHMMIVYAHLLLLVAGDGWCSRAWSELGELIALAILTQPSPLLQNAGGGIKNWQTWKLRTFVREVTPDGRLELVLKETVGSPMVLVELDDGQDSAQVEPEADRRYG